MEHILELYSMKKDYWTRCFDAKIVDLIWNING
jgi:hypothetical protein